MSAIFRICLEALFNKDFSLVEQIDLKIVTVSLFSESVCIMEMLTTEHSISETSMEFYLIREFWRYQDKVIFFAAFFDT